MTAEAIINAVADKLAALWPERKVRVDEVPADADGHYFVSLETPAQKRELAQRHRRTSTVSVVYFTKKHENMAYHAWAETMFQNFDTLDVAGQLYYPINQHAEQTGREYHFLFDLDIGVTFADPPDETMETLTQEGGLKDGKN